MILIGFLKKVSCSTDLEKKTSYFTKFKKSRIVYKSEYCILNNQVLYMNKSKFSEEFLVCLILKSPENLVKRGKSSPCSLSKHFKKSWIVYCMLNNESPINVLFWRMNTSTNKCTYPVYNEVFVFWRRVLKVHNIFFCFCDLCLLLKCHFITE